MADISDVNNSLAGLSSVISSAANNLNISRMHKRDKKWANEQNEIARKWQEKMWNAANEYSSPVQQLQRFKEAGLNPNLVFGQGANSVAASYGSPSQTSAPSTPQSFANLGDAFMVTAQLKQMDAATRLTDEQARTEQVKQNKMMSETKGQDLQNDYSMSTLEARVTYMKESVNLQRTLQAAHSQEITESIQRTYESSVRCQDIFNQIINRDKITDAQVDKYNSDIYVAQQSLQHSLNLMDAQARKEFAIAFMSYCQGGFYNAAAKTEGARYSVLLSEKDLNTERCKALGIKNKFDLDNYNLRCKKLMSEYANGLKNGRILDVTLGIKGQEFEMAKKENKIYYLKQGVNMVTDLTNAAANVAGAASGVGGVAIGFARLGQQSVNGSSVATPPPLTGPATYIQGGGLYY